ncbi:chain length determinant protein EpsF [uncultured Aquabacterium sp.]|uniref:chain length determinant protein EpsF n=2 Tax=Pseudomonadota TaxID=1224 RepID=UPI0025E4BB91|nr:chain length determinant protein EpsF [uncultured Aquabacterium sp.]
MSFAQFLAILRARWKAPTFTLLILVTVALLLAFLLPKKYTAEGSVVVENRSPDPINGTLLPQTSQYLATQVGIIQSERVAKRVIRNLRLTDSPVLRERWQEATEGQGDFETWISESLLNSLEVKPERNANVIGISYVAADPNFASALVNEFIKAYVDVNLELRVSPAKQFSSMFAGELAQARENLEAAQRKLSAFQQEKGIIATDERIDVETARLNELSAQLVSLQAVTADAISRRAQTGLSSPDAMNSAVIMGLKADLARQEARLKEEGDRYADSHPVIGRLKAGIEELKARIQAESVAVGRTTGVSAQIAMQREAQTRSLLEAQRDKVLKLKAMRDEAMLLATDVASAQRAFDGIQARVQQTTLESRLDQTNVAVLRYATPPYRHSSPRKLLYVLQAIFVGLFLGIGLAVVRELRDRRVRLDQDLSELIGAPNLGSMPEALPGSAKKRPLRLFPLSGGKADLRLPSPSV